MDTESSQDFENEDALNQLRQGDSTSPVSEYINIFEDKWNHLKCRKPDSSLNRRSSLQTLKSPGSDQDKSSVNSRHKSILSTPESFYSNNSCDHNLNRTLKKTIAINNLNNSTSLEVAEIATMNDMELCRIEDIDVDQIPGYAKIPENIPDWKRYHLERKNKEAINLYLTEKQKEENEKNRYGNIPQWKKNLIMKKEIEYNEKLHPTDPDIDKYGNIPLWKKELLKKKNVTNNNQ